VVASELVAAMLSAEADKWTTYELGNVTEAPNKPLDPTAPNAAQPSAGQRHDVEAEGEARVPL